MIAFNNGVANVRQTPGISADTLANRPAATVVAVGTIYITSDTNNIYRSDGENWQLIGSGSGSVPGIDDVLSVSQNLLDNRLIDINGNNLDITDQNTGSVLCIFSSSQGQFFGISSGLSLLLNGQTYATNSLISQDGSGIARGLYLNVSNRTYALGEWNDTNNKTSITVSDSDQYITLKAASKLILTGTGLQSTTAGGSSGKHLIITLNGTQYKIALNNM